MNKIVITVLLLLTISNITVHSDDCNYQLVLTSETNNAIYVGDFIIMKLELKGDNLESLISNIVKDANGKYIGNSTFSRRNQLVNPYVFENKIVIEALKSGEFEIGPYNIKMGDCIITSNSLVVNVAMESKSKIGYPKEITFSLKNSKINLGDSLQISITANYIINDFSLTNIDGLEFQVIDKSNSMSFTGNNQKIIERLNLKIYSKKKGKYFLNRNLFKNIGPDVNVRELVIEVD